MITLTDKAQKKIEALLVKRTDMIGIRIGVKTTGCSGYAYVLEYANAQTDTDMDNAFGNVHIYIDRKHELMLSGMTIDYVREGLNEGFKFINPLERDRCGCGESFRI